MKRKAIGGFIALIAGAILVACAPGTTARRTAPATPMRAAVAVRESASRKVDEQREYIANMDPGNFSTCLVTDDAGKTMTVTMDTSLFAQLSSEDQEFVEKDLWAFWQDTYARHHPRKRTPANLTLNIYDVSGAQIASYS